MESTQTPLNNDEMQFDIKEILKFAEVLAVRVGKKILSKRNEIKIENYKDRRDVVTNLDLEAEEIIISEINKKYPDHSVYSEEAGDDRKKSDYKWIIDPIDGTKEFARGLPMFNTSFSLEYRKRVLVSVVYRPVDGELNSAGEGLGAFVDGKKASVSRERELKNSFVYSYLPTFKLEEKKSVSVWKKLQKLSRASYRVRGIAEINSALCWVGSGKVEAMINLGLQPMWHDVVSGLLMAKEGGAIISDIRGGVIVNNNLKNGLVVSNGKIHNQLLEVLN